MSVPKVRTFKEPGFKLKEAIERGVYKGRFTEGNIVTLLERLSRLVVYVGREYKTTEVKKMLSDSIKGYGHTDRYSP